jgi:hypothetical protein
MIVLALAATLAAAHGTRAYRVAVSGPAGSSVTVSAKPPAGWTAAFCSVHLCAVGHVPLTIGATGTSYVDLHLYVGPHSTHGAVLVTARGTTLRLSV